MAKTCEPKPEAYIPQDWPFASPWREFLQAFEQTGNISHAARITGVHRWDVHRRVKRSARFAEAFAEAREIATENLEMGAWRRAVTGVSKPIYHGGEIVGAVNDYSDRLMEVLLKANAPDKYKERSESVQTTHKTVRIIIQKTDENAPDPILPPEPAD